MSNSSSAKSARGGASSSSSLPRSNSKSISVNQTTSPNSPDATPTIAHIKIQDNCKLLPRYSAALSRPHDDSMPAEDLDAIQLELELLLSTVALRARGLKYESENLDKEDRRDRKGKHIERQPSSPGKRKRDEKKIKENTKYFGGQAKLPKLKNSSVHSPATSQHPDDRLVNGFYLFNL